MGGSRGWMRRGDGALAVALLILAACARTDAPSAVSSVHVPRTAAELEHTLLTADAVDGDWTAEVERIEEPAGDPFEICPGGTKAPIADVGATVEPRRGRHRHDRRVPVDLRLDG